MKDQETGNGELCRVTPTHHGKKRKVEKIIIHSDIIT